MNVNEYLGNIFAKYLTGFKTNRNTQNSLLRMIEFCKTRLSNGSKMGVTVMDLSKAFDSRNSEMLQTKLCNINSFIMDLLAFYKVSI